MSKLIDDEFNNYIALKNILKFDYKGIDLSKIIALDLAALSYKQENDYKVILEKTVKNFISSKNFYELKKAYLSNAVLVTCTTDRKDYLELAKVAIADIISSALVPTFKLKKKIQIDLHNFCFSLSCVFKTDFQGVRLRLVHKIYIASCLCYYLNSIDNLYKEFEDFNFEDKKFLSFNSAHRYDSMLTQFFKEKGIKTYSLSHGLNYVNYLKKIPLDNINRENISTDTVFVWGKSSKLDLVENIGFNPSKIIIGGNPKYPKKEINVKKTFKFGFILLGRNIYDNGNKEILNIAKKLSKQTDLEFKVKLHPSLDKKKYVHYCEKIGLDIIADPDKTVANILEDDQFDFAIVNNSTAYYEAMYYNIVCFRYEPDINEDYVGLNDKFTNLATLKEKIKFFSEYDSEKLNTNVNNLLVEVLGMGINNYKYYLDE